MTVSRPSPARSGAQQRQDPTSGPALQADPRVAGLWRLVTGALRPAPGLGRIAFALGLGALTHFIFALAVLAMIMAMFFGMSESFGRVPQPWAWLANLALIAQFPLMHSVLLTGPGGRALQRMIPGPHGKTVASTTYALVASLQLLVLFTFWTPSGIIWWRAEGAALVGLCLAYAIAWALLMKASFDAGAEVQSGALGWMSLLARRAPRFPDMPTLGLFRVIRQPIYLAFALTLWTVPVWTPDQLLLASGLTAYCLLAPKLKERRFEARYGARFDAYRATTPYMIPKFRKTDAQ